MTSSAKDCADRHCLAARFVEGPHLFAPDEARQRLAGWLGDLAPEQAGAPEIQDPHRRLRVDGLPGRRQRHAHARPQAQPEHDRSGRDVRPRNDDRAGLPSLVHRRRLPRDDPGARKPSGEIVAERFNKFEPMDLANMRQNGVRSIEVMCHSCRHAQRRPIPRRPPGAGVRAAHGLWAKGRGLVVGYYPRHRNLLFCCF